MIPALGIVLALFGSWSFTYGLSITDNFESYTVGDNPTGWTVTEGTSNSLTDVVQIIATNAPGTSGSKAVQLIKNSAINGSPIIAQTFATGNTSLAVEFDYLFVNKTATPNIRLYAGGSIAANLRMTSNEALQRPAYLGSTTNYLSVNLASNTWYHFKIEVDSASKMSFQVSGPSITTTTLTNLDLAVGKTVGMISQIQLRYSGAANVTGDYTLDNVTVSDTLDPVATKPSVIVLFQ
jgi:hypothetical protein